MARVKGLFSTTGVETSSSSVSSSWHKLSNCPADEATSVVEKLVTNLSVAELPFFMGEEVVGRFAPKCVVVPAGRPYLSSGKARMEALNSDETSKLSLFALGLNDPVLGSI